MSQKMKGMETSFIAVPQGIETDWSLPESIGEISENVSDSAN